MQSGAACGVLSHLFPQHFADAFSLFGEIFDEALDTGEDLLALINVPWDAVPYVFGALYVFQEHSSSADGGDGDACLAFPGGEQDGACDERTGGQSTGPGQVGTLEFIGEAERGVRRQLGYGHLIIPFLASVG